MGDAALDTFLAMLTMGAYMPAAVARDVRDSRNVPRDPFQQVNLQDTTTQTAAYQEALKALGDGAVRDLRIVPAAA